MELIIVNTVVNMSKQYTLVMRNIRLMALPVVRPMVLGELCLHEVFVGLGREKYLD